MVAALVRLGSGGVHRGRRYAHRLPESIPHPDAINITIQEADTQAHLDPQVLRNASTRPLPAAGEPDPHSNPGCNPDSDRDPVHLADIARPSADTTLERR